MINITSKVTIEDLESVSSLPPADREGIQLATQLPGHTLGFQASLLQFLITWLNRSQSSTLKTYVQAGQNQDTNIENLASTVHGLVAMLSAQRVLRADGYDITESAKLQAARRYRELNKIEVKGSRLLMLVADGHPYVPMAAPFIGLAPKDHDQRARKRDAFLHDLSFNLNRCFRNSGAFPLQGKDSNAILETIYELFANSEEWGTTDLAFTPLRNSIRGLTGDIVPFSVLHQKMGQTNISRTLARYFKSLPQNVEATHVLEMSVFDSGVGLAQRCLRTSIEPTLALSIEYQAVLNCLRKRSSSSGDTTRGMGLFEVMKLLTRLKGFLRIRSGRLSLFRDFVEDEFYDAGPPRSSKFREGFEFMWDWSIDPREDKSSGSGDMKLVQRSFTEGTLLTLWIPLKIQETQLSLFTG